MLGCWLKVPDDKRPRELLPRVELNREYEDELSDGTGSGCSTSENVLSA